MSVIDLYSVPIFVYNLDSSEQIITEEAFVLKNIEMKKDYGDDGNYLSKEGHVLKKYNLNRIYNLCNKHVKHYTENILGITDDFKMFKSWLTMNEQGTKHLAHSHRNTMLSCVLYFDENLSDEPMAPINFSQKGLDNIFRTFQFDFKSKERNKYNNKVLTVYPKTNTMIIFPGWVQHETEEARFLTKRYCIGTNYFFVGESAKGYHNINIDVS